MLVVLVLAALAVVGCAVKVSQGHGGALAEFTPDTPPLVLPAGRMDAADLAGLQLPIGLVGYQTDAVDATLQRAAISLSERDAHIAALEQRLAQVLAERLYGRPEDSSEPARPTDHVEPADPAHDAHEPDHADPGEAAAAEAAGKTEKIGKAGTTESAGEADSTKTSDSAHNAESVEPRPQVATAAANGAWEDA
ncbi:hypothetical protein [Microtetraspora glauca]|uniref:DivIVA domain-containing protein n=1 Tax=Microtetraspora glauca TaxID=1996 RepID=A0ABV3GCE1_MICGL